MYEINFWADWIAQAYLILLEEQLRITTSLGLPRLNEADFLNLELLLKANMEELN